MQNEAKQQIIDMLQNRLDVHKAKLAAWNVPGVLRGEQWIVYFDHMIREINQVKSVNVMLPGDNLKPMLFNEALAQMIASEFRDLPIRYDVFLMLEINDFEDRIEQVNKL